MSSSTAAVPMIGAVRYKKVKSAILAALQTQEWKGGEVIPSEKRLAERFAVSIGTLRKAIDELCAENILTRHQGLGTFVAMHQRNQHFFRFFRVVRRDGQKAFPDVSLVNFRKIKASREVAAQLEIDNGAPVFQLTNQLALHDKAVMVEIITVPEEKFAGLSKAILQARQSTLYHLYQEAFGINVVSTDERVRIVIASTLESRLLGLARNTPVLEIQRVAYSYQRRPVEYRLSHVNTAHYDYIASDAHPLSEDLDV